MYDDMLHGQNCKGCCTPYEPFECEQQTTRHNHAAAIWHLLRSTTNTPWNSHIWDNPISHCNLTLVSHAHIYTPLTGWIYRPKPTAMQFATPNAGGRPALNSDLHSPTPLSMFSLFRLRIRYWSDRPRLLFLVVFQKEIISISRPCDRCIRCWMHSIPVAYAPFVRLHTTVCVKTAVWLLTGVKGCQSQQP